MPDQIVRLAPLLGALIWRATQAQRLARRASSGEPISQRSIGQLER